SFLQPLVGRVRHGPLNTISSALSPLRRVSGCRHRSSDRRTRFVPICALLVGVRDLQNARFIECFADELQTDRQAMTADVSEPARYADSANSRQVRCNSENIGEIHLQWVRDAFA